MLNSTKKLISTFSPIAQRQIVNSSVRYSSWLHVTQGPPDPILGLTVAFNNDKSPNKVSLGVGAYRDDAGKPLVLGCVRKAEQKLFESKGNHEYSGIDGVPSFVKAARDLAFGADHPLVAKQAIASTQTLSGTGALRVAGAYLKAFLPADAPKVVYLPNPTWPNHRNVFRDSGLETKTYRYYNAATNGLDIDGLVQDLENAPNRSTILLHACAHNPTGVDPSLDEWRRISRVCQSKNHYIFFDSAYQGFASGDPEKDAQAYKLFIEEGHPIILCQSFAKNMGLYGERIGALHITGPTKENADNILSQLKILIRPMYSNPPIYGANLAAAVLNDPALHAQWRVELKEMADRINTMRASLVKELANAGSTKNWSHITSQIGMFCYTGLTVEQVTKLKEEHHLYMTSDGRISVAGLNSGNVAAVAKAIHAVSK